MTVNLNDQFRVKLSAYGKAIWIKYHRDLGMDTPAMMFDGSGYLVLPLWEISLVFGSHLWMGSNKLPFASMDLEAIG